MNEMAKRIEALEKTLGPGEFGKRVEEIVYATSVTGDVFDCLGETWERKQGESDNAIRKRALQDLLNNDRRTLTIKLCQNVAKLIWEKMQ